MSTNVIYLKSNEHMALPPLNHLRPAGDENLNFSPTIHVNPLCRTNKILVNKEKLNKGVRSIEAQLTNPTTERIYYNPKFLTKHVQNASKNYVTPKCQHPTSRNETVKALDSNIHINRNYLLTLNDARTVKSLSYLCDETRLNNNKQSLCGIHINPKFIKQQKPVENMEVDKVANRSLSSSSQSAGTISVKNISSLRKKNYLKNTAVKLTVQPKSKYKFVKNTNSPPKIQNPEKNQVVLKPLCFKTKYSLKRLAVGKENNKTNYKNSEVPKFKMQINSKIKLVKTSSEFKKLSRTKLVRKSVLQSMILARRSSRNNLFRKLLIDRTLYRRIPLKEKATSITYFPKRNGQISKNEIASIGNSSFKRLSKMKIVRKSLLKAQIEARNRVRKQYLRDHRVLRIYNKSYISKFKLRNSSNKRIYVNKQRSLLRWRKKKQGSDTSRIKCKKTNSNPPSSKSLRKNNQPCPFYNRFGRCKGKDRGTCPKLHDSKYISICRKLLQGECNAKDCLLSHDIRPGKMPTCHHYLAGLCTRPNCPFLHIKVNPKAPICTAFLQGFCPDVFNCLKRHEFICPIYAEKGACPRGKSCTYPHRSPIVHSKLLKDDQKPLLIHRTDSSVRISSVESITKPEVSESTETLLDCDSRKNRKRNIENNKNIKKSKKEYVREAFKRYFAVNKTDESSDNDEKKLKESFVGVSVNEFR